MSPRSSYRPHAFISYYSRGVDAKVAKALREALSQHRVRVDAWRDRENLTPGTKYILELQKAIATCDFFLLLLSPRSVGSEWCRKEWLRALRLEKHLIVLFLEDVPAAQWPLELEGLQYIDIQRGLGEGLPSLLATLGVASGDSDPLDDPLDRDAARMAEFAHFFYYFASNPLINAAVAKIIVGRQGPVMLETPRGKDIVARVCASDETDCRALGNALLALWKAPAPIPPSRARTR